MARQRTNVSGYPLYPECTVILQVSKRPVLKSKRDDESVKFYVWDFDVLQADNEDIDNEVQFLFFSSQMGDLLAAVGGVETSPGKYDWDDEEVVGKCVRADIVHEIFKGDTRHTLKEIEAYEEPAAEEEEVEGVAEVTIDKNSEEKVIDGEVIDAGEPKGWDDELNPDGTPIK